MSASPVVRYFEDEIRDTIKHTNAGTVSMANVGPNLNASQFFITTRPGLDYLDGKHTAFGEVRCSRSRGMFAVFLLFTPSFCRCLRGWIY